MKNEIEIDIKKLGEPISYFMNKEIAHCNKLGIKVILKDRPRIYSDGAYVSGFFDDEAKELHAGCKGPLGRWLGTFVHETCHKDQWHEKDPVYDRLIKGHVPHQIYGMWMDHVVDLNKEQLQTVIHAIMDLELDNEKRTVAKIKKYGLPIDPKEYIRKANSYIFYHKALQVKRKWYDKQPWAIDRLGEHFPDKFLAKKEYYNPPRSVLNLMLKECWKE